MLTDMEDTFRLNEVRIRIQAPIHHRAEKRADGHIFITVLAYHLLHTIRFRLRQKGIHLSFSTIRDRLSTHTRTTTTMKRKDGKMIHIRKSSGA